jgi:hypothetical protein
MIGAVVIDHSRSAAIAARALQPEQLGNTLRPVNETHGGFCRCESKGWMLMTQTDEAQRAVETIHTRLPAALGEFLTGAVIDRRQIRSTTVRIALLVLIRHSASEDPCASGELLCPGQSRALRILQQVGLVGDADDIAAGSSVCVDRAQLPKPGPHLDEITRNALLGCR